MKKVLFLLFSISCLSNIAAQTTIAITKNGQTKKITYDVSQSCNPKETFTIVPQMPSYEGGEKKLLKELRDRVSISKEVKGKCSVLFTINCEGKAFGFQIVHSINKETDDEIIRHLEQLQNWSAGVHRGQTVDCSYRLNFKVKKGKLTISR